MSAPVPRRASAPVADTAAAPAVRGTFKEQLFAQQKSKYQAGINAALEELTRLQASLQQYSGNQGSLRDRLRGVGSELYKTTRELVQQRHKRHGKALLNAVLLVPLWRAFRRGGRLVKLVIVGGLFYVVSSMVGFLTRSSEYDWIFSATMLVYLGLVVPVFFIIELILQRRGPRKLVERNADKLKFPALYVVYPGQDPFVEKDRSYVRALRVASASRDKILEDDKVPVQSGFESGGVFLTLGNLGTYSLSYGCDPALVARNEDADPLARTDGDLIDQAVQQQAEKLDPLVGEVSEFALLRWQERQQRAEVPRLENLLRQVERLESIWAPVTVTKPCSSS